MNTRDEYWQNKRVVAGMERNKEETLKVIKDVNVEYKKKLKDIKHEIADFYAKYGKGDVLDYSKITSKLDDKDFNTMIRDWDKFVKKYPDMERFRDIRMNYYKLDRLQGLSNRIALHVAELGKTEEEMLKGTLKGTFKKAFNNITNLFKKQSKISRDVELLKDKRIDGLIKQKWLDGNNFSDRTWKDKAKLQNYLDKQLITDMATGKSYDDIYKNLAREMDTTFSNAKRLIHTEMANVQNMAHLEGIKKAGFNGFKISATIDSRTSSICRNKNGKTEFIEDYQVGVTAPPFHPYCRSTIFGVDKEVDKPTKKVDNEYSIDELRGVGKRVKKDFLKISNYEKRADELRELKKGYMGVVKEIRSAPYGTDLSDLRKKGRLLYEEYSRKYDEAIIENAKELKETLSKYRKMGAVDIDYTGHLRNRKADKLVKKAYDFLPTDWIKSSVNHSLINGEMETGIVKRGYYSSFLNTLKISGSSESMQIETAIHELMHRLEHTHKSFVKHEAVFYEHRTAGEELQQLTKVTGIKHGKHEVTRVDNFVDAYMGKWYDGNAYELLSMGVQYLYARPQELLKDEEMAEWVLGALANI
jgi:SPP1 gp7 family putative phage head morphogenesis protein